MSLEYIVLLISWLISLVLLFVYVPKNRIPHAIIVFLFAQSLTWGTEMLFVMLKWIEYPVREFPHATNISFSRHFMIYPTIFVLFALYYPNHRKKWEQGLYVLLYTAVMQIYAYFITKYTALIEMENWVFYVIFFMFIFQSVIVIRFYNWFREGLRE